MYTVIDILKKTFQRSIIESFPDLASDGGVIDAEITRSTQSKFGHYQFNGAMKLTKQLRQNPRMIAEQIMNHVGVEIDGEKIIASMEIAGPGFINITLDSSFVSSRVKKALNSSRLGLEKPEEIKKVVIDFCGANTAKEMHVGHLRSSIIGETLCRLFEFLGHDVLRLSHIGDWGTQFGMLITYMKDEVPEVLKGEQAPDSTALVQWYREAKKRFDADPVFKERSQKEVVALQGGELEAMKAWKHICAISHESFQEIYDILDVTVIERGESFYNSRLSGIVQDLEEKGLVTISDGARCAFLDGFINREGEPLPMIIQKSDGGYNYSTTDMAAIRHRVEEENADRIIYVTDAGQATHFAMIFKLAEKAGYVNPEKTQVHHVPFGLVCGEDGKKFRTRSGDTERLIDLLNEAISRAQAIVDERNPDMPEEERVELARCLGIGAVKYADLSSNRTSDYIFSYDRMLQFEGNTAAFLMYAYVRVVGIKRKLGLDESELSLDSEINLNHPSEIALGVHLLQFPEVLDKMAQELLPNRLTDYLYGLADKFNAFFRDCRVEGTEEQNSRLLLCEAVARTLKKGLEILGVKTVQRM